MLKRIFSLNKAESLSNLNRNPEIFRIQILFVFLYFMAKFWKLKMLKRFRYGGRDLMFDYESEYYLSCKNHESEYKYLGFGGKDSNPNLNIH